MPNLRFLLPRQGLYLGQGQGAVKAIRAHDLSRYPVQWQFQAKDIIVGDEDHSGLAQAAVVYAGSVGLEAEIAFL